MTASTGPLPAEVDVAVIGAGFSGIAMAVRLRRAGRRDFLVLERSGSLGGTWRDNTYPGCTCDVPSHLYSFSFAPNPDWSSTFSPQPEIWEYLERVARDQGVLPHVRFNCELEGAAWDAASQRWRLHTSDGDLLARVLVAAAGPLSEPSIPELPGLDSFQGAVFHSARWDHAHDLDGERVAVVGTGASAIQFVPVIQPRVGRLVLFQRTPPWIMPHRARPLRDWERRLYRRLPVAQRLVRAGIAWARELYAIPMLRAGLQPLTRRIGLRLLERQVSDPELRRRLTPTYAPGCKRILLSHDFYPAIQQPNVELVAEAVREVRAHSIVAASGAEYEVDTIIFGTGFHVTDIPIAKRIRGAGGRSLEETWDGSPRAHRGTAVAGFPNLFLLLGPNTGLGHTSVVLMAEAQVGYVLGALREMDRRRVAALEVRAEVQAAWNRRLQRAMRGTVWTAGGCASWYLDRNGLNTTLWPGFAGGFTRLMRRFDAASYVTPGFSPRVVVTGAASGIGAATLAALRGQGAEAVGLDLRAGGEIIECDVRDQASVDRAVEAAIERLGGLDVLINCAGIGLPQRAGQRPGADALAVVDVNLFGPWRVTAAALPALRAARGRVINIASGLAFVTLPFVPAYCASKRGLAAYGDALRLEHGDEVSVTTVYPGYLRTPIHEPAAALGLSLEGVVRPERMTDAVALIVRCALGPRPPRHVATSRGGALTYWALRHLPPGLVARTIERRMRRWRREHPAGAASVGL